MSASTLGNIASATSNATSHLTAFPADLAHFLANAASFAFIKVPERLENIFLGGGSTIAEATGNESGRIISAALSHSASITSADSTARNMASFVSSDAAVAGLQDLAFNHVRSLGGFFTYLTSKWALATTVLVSIRGVIAPSRQLFEQNPLTLYAGSHPQSHSDLCLYEKTPAFEIPYSTYSTPSTHLLIAYTMFTTISSSEVPNKP